MNQTQKTRRRVLIAVNDFLIGGAQKLILDLTNEWGDELYDLHLVTFMSFNKKDFFAELPSYVTQHHLPMKGMYDVAGILRVRSFIKDLSPDVILSNLYFSNTVIRVANLGLHRPVVTVEHNTYTNKNMLQHMVDWILSHTSARIIAVSEQVAQFLRDVQHISPKKILVISNGINLAHIKARRSEDSRESVRASLHIEPNEIVILHVGRLVSQKDPILMLRSYALFSKQSQTPSRLLVVGDGDLLTIMKEEVQRLDISTRVIFVGEGDPHPYYMASDIFLSTSRIEGFGLVRAEALAYGLPVVTTATGGVDELIQDGYNGAVVSQREPELIAKEIGRVVTLDRNTLRAQSEASVQKFSIEKTSQEYARVFSDVCKEYVH